MARLHFGSRSVSLEMTDTLDQLYRRAVDQVAPGMLGRLERATGEVFDAAVRAWPVKTGRSKAGLQQQILIGADRASIVGRIYDLVPYAKYVRPRTLGGKSAFVELLRKPIQAKTKELVDELAAIAKAGLVR